jgi:hypothetical protein
MTTYGHVTRRGRYSGRALKTTMRFAFVDYQPRWRFRCDVQRVIPAPRCKTCTQKCENCLLIGTREKRRRNAAVVAGGEIMPDMPPEAPYVPSYSQIPPARLSCTGTAPNAAEGIWLPGRTLTVTRTATTTPKKCGAKGSFHRLPPVPQREHLIEHCSDRHQRPDAYFISCYSRPKQQRRPSMSDAIDCFRM